MSETQFHSRRIRGLRALAVATACLFAVGCGCAGAHKPDVLPDNASATTRGADQAVEAAIAQAFGATEKALEDSDDAVGWRVTDPVGSCSRGTVTDGELRNGVELRPDGEFHSIIDRLRKYNARWGTHELVRLIQKAAHYVHLADGGAPLRVGDLSKKDGGDIRWHRSHNSGRDVDLAFYVVDADTGESVAAPRLLHFDGNGVSRQRKDLRFDVARNWRLVEGLLEQNQVRVQWLFISRPLKKLLLDHARQRGANAEIVRRAEAVLHQPKGASPHANHFHLRIGCSLDDRVDGCIDSGPQWDWEVQRHASY
jgi:penicillin-insensitive murein endopeptidase